LRIERGRVRHVHKLKVIAKQPGGLRTMSDDELIVWARHLGTGLARAENSMLRVGGRAGRHLRLTVLGLSSTSAARGGRAVVACGADFAARFGSAPNGPRLIDQDSRSPHGRAAVPCQP
jgi:hypothetical protein